MRPAALAENKYLRPRAGPGKEMKSMKYVCSVCGYVYDEAVGELDSGIAPGTAWADVPDDFVCPVCGVGKDSFNEE